MITEQQKSSTMKIDEPKTPFIHYHQSTDDIVGSANGTTPQELQKALDEANFSLGHDDEPKHENNLGEDDWETDDQTDDQTGDEDQGILYLTLIKSKELNSAR
jgi:Protein phosphatase inhibitor 2 (IPP-2)